MGKRKVTVDALGGAIMDILKEYENDVEEALDPVLKKTTQTARAELKATSPKDRGKYAKGWQYKTKKTPKTTSYTIYNGSEPTLTHLLEKGHALRQGGRVPAHPHIQKVEDQVKEKLPEEVKRAIAKC